MKKQMMISAAAIALIAGGAVANAQGMQDRGAAPRGAVEMKGEAKGGAELRGTTGQAAPAEKIAPRAEKPAPATTGQAVGKGDVDVKARTDKPEMKRDMKGADVKSDMKARSDSKPANDTKSAADSKSTVDTKAKADNKADAKSTTTTGQGAAGSQGSANLSAEQRTKIKTVIRETNVRPVTNVNFSISIGTRVPRNVGFHPLPVTVVEYYPAWRGYEFILVGDEIVVINPRTLEIVAVIEA